MKEERRQAGRGSAVGPPSSGGATPNLSTATSTDLLAALRTAANRTAWHEYIRRFRPLIIRCARRLGIPKDDAEDAAQQTLIAFSEAYRRGQFDRSKGRLRDWLFGIARNQILLFARRRKKREKQVVGDGRGTGFFARLPDEHSWENLWNEEWRDAILQRCLKQIKGEVEPQTMEAFELFVHKEWPAQKVAEHLGITANAVFGAKRRVLNRLKELLPRMEEIW